jgi:transposase InsO family protein
VRRLHDLCESPEPAPPSERRRGSSKQLPERQREQTLRGNLVQFADDLHGHGQTFLQIADLLRLSTRTLRSWRIDFRSSASAAVPLGRPAVRSPRDERSAVLAALDELGPATGLPTLCECFPSMPRAELEDLLRRYRRVWQRRHQCAPRILHWQTPGAVWAMDFTEAPASIDGCDPYLLAVRDLGSGQQLLWLPVPKADAEHTIAALRSLMAQHGPPLVLKTDNGSPFGAGVTQDFLRESKVFSLFSPPRTPRYNGAIEAGIGSLKSRTERHATREGRPGLWTRDDVAFAQLEANTTARPLGPTGPTPDERWRARTELTPAQRTELAAIVETYRREALPGAGSPPESDLSTTRLRLIDREAIRRALVELGYLLFSRRRLPLPISCAKTADLS